jgi:hypothetical protein
MKLKQYLRELNKLVDTHPEVLEFNVVYSCDDEGNRFDHVLYTPTIGTFDPIGLTFDSDVPKENAVCIN